QGLEHLRGHGLFGVEGAARGGPHQKEGGGHHHQEHGNGLQQPGQEEFQHGLLKGLLKGLLRSGKGFRLTGRGCREVPCRTTPWPKAPVRREGTTAESQRATPTLPASDVRRTQGTRSAPGAGPPTSAPTPSRRAMAKGNPAEPTSVHPPARRSCRGYGPSGC